MTIEHFDVLTIGAGLSGIGAAHHLQTKCADRSYAILEGRDRIGGTCSKPSHRAAHRSSPIKLICDHVCRLLNYMKRHGVTHWTPRNIDRSITTEPWVNFSSGYFQRSLHLFPKQGSRVPWKLHQNYPRDIMLLRLGRIERRRAGVCAASLSVCHAAATLAWPPPPVTRYFPFLILFLRPYALRFEAKQSKHSREHLEPTRLRWVEIPKEVDRQRPGGRRSEAGLGRSRP